MPLVKGSDWTKLNDQQLVFAHFEIHRAFGTFKRFNKYTDSEQNSWSLEDFFNQHKLIYDEMKRRGMNVDPEDDMLKIGPHTIQDTPVANLEVVRNPYGCECGWEEYLSEEELKLLANVCLSCGKPKLKKLEKGSFAPVFGSGNILGEEINLEDVEKYFKEFRIVWPLVYLTGGIVNRGSTQGDIDIFIRTLKNDPINLPIMFRISRMLPKELAQRTQFLFEDTTYDYPHVPGPYTSHVPLYGLEARRLRYNKVEMAKQIQLGTYFTPLKPTIGYKAGVVFGYDALGQLVDADMYPIVVQKKYDGARIQIHKDNKTVKIYSDDGKRIEHRMPTFVEFLQKPEWPLQMILDAECEMWVRGKHQGREVVSGFLRGEQKLLPGEDHDLVPNVFDILWLGKKGGALNNLTLAERMEILDKLPIRQSTDKVPRTGEFNKTPSYIANNTDEMIRFAKKVSEMPGSEGAMVKSLKSKYELDGQTGQWFKYKKTADYNIVVVDRVETATPDVYVYHMGVIPSANREFNTEDERDVMGHKYQYVGKTMNTSIKVNKGEVLKVSAENVFVYSDKLRLYLPVVVEPTSEKPYSADTVEEVAREAGLLQTKMMQTSWPSEDKKYDFVMQHHYRGKSVHSDFRAEVNDHLEGWTIFSQPAGAVKEEPTTLAEAKKIDATIDFKWPKSDVHAQATEKASQPKEWISVQGKFEPGTVGATREKEGFMLIVDNGVVEYGARKPWFYEYFIQGKKNVGRIIFRFIPRGLEEIDVELPTSETNGHYHMAKVDSKTGIGKTTIADNHWHDIVEWKVVEKNNHTHEIPWEHKKDQTEVGFWNTWMPEDGQPYVLSDGARKEKWVPPQGISALPQSIRSQIPPRYRYWEHASQAKRIEVRDQLVKDMGEEFTVKQKFDEKHWLLEKEGKTYLGTICGCAGDKKTVTRACLAGAVEVFLERKNFVLQHHWWKGQQVIRGGPSVEHWDLIIVSNDEMIIMTDDPLKGHTNASIRKPYTKDWHEKGKNAAELISPGTPGNPTKDTPAWVEIIDSGELVELESGDLFRRYNFYGKQLKGTFAMKKESPDMNLWDFGKVEMPGQKLNEKTMKLEAGQVVKAQSVYLSIEKFQKMQDKFVVVGSALSYGVWNGDWYGPEVLDDRPERILGVGVYVGHHEPGPDDGTIIDFEYDKESHTIKVAAEVLNPIKQKKIEDGEFVGFSVEISVLADDVRHVIERILSYDRVNIVQDPACVVCKFDRVICGA